MTIYISSAFANREQATKLAMKLMSDGYLISSRWLWRDNATSGEYGMKADYAKEDLADIDKADVFLMIGDNGLSKGGRFVELGYALAHKSLSAILFLQEHGIKEQNPFEAMLDGKNEYEIYQALKLLCKNR